MFELGAGLIARSPLGPRPTERLVLYEFEACPFCRKVREALSELDLEALILPCPKGGTRFRAEALAKGGRPQFPYLVDAHAGLSIYESDAIVRHLFSRYGSAPPPLTYSVRPLALFVSVFRGPRGLRARPSQAPEQPLELYSFEASPYCRLVRERLCELELPYVLHNVAKRSPSRPAFVALSGRMMVPYLVDPNTQVSMFESADILAYLDERYAR